MAVGGRGGGVERGGQAGGEGLARRRAGAVPEDLRRREVQQARGEQALLEDPAAGVDGRGEEGVVPEGGGDDAVGGAAGGEEAAGLRGAGVARLVGRRQDGRRVAQAEEAAARVGGVGRGEVAVRVAVDGVHEAGFGVEVAVGPLDDAEGVDPDVADAEGAAGDDDGLLEVFGQLVPGDAARGEERLVFGCEVDEGFLAPAVREGGVFDAGESGCFGVDYTGWSVNCILSCWINVEEPCGREQFAAGPMAATMGFLANVQPLSTLFNRSCRICTRSQRRFGRCGSEAW